MSREITGLTGPETVARTAAYKIGLATLFGVTLTSVLALLLNTALAVPSFLLLSPGGLLATLLTKASGLGPPPLTLLAANSIFYASIAAVAIHLRFRPSPARLRIAVLALVAPSILLASLAFLPKFDPLWPRGMDDLTNKLNDFQVALPLQLSLEEARSRLKSRGIDVLESTQSRTEDIWSDGRNTITASAGDRVIFLRVPTEASEFPCGFDIYIILDFDPDGRMTQRHIDTLPICP